jgi:hypothetical protein
MSYKIEFRNGTAAEWASANPVLGIGEVGIVTDAGATSPNAKLGDGSTTWPSLGWWLPGGSNVYDVVTTYGADPTGTADSTSAIQDALNATPLGGQTYIPPGVFKTSAPLIIPPQVTLSGPYGSHIDAAASCIKPVSQANGFSGAAVILMVDQTTGGYAIPSNQQRIMNLTLECSNLTGSTIDGVQAQGFVHGVILDDLQIRHPPAHGLAIASNGSGVPYSWRAHRVVANTCGTHGFSLTLTDSTWTDCEAIGCVGNGFNFAGSAANSHFIGCRAEFNAIGVSLSGAWGSGTGSGGMTFTDLSTDRNTQDGVLIAATGTTPVNFLGCSFRRDGRNGNSGGGGYAGLRCSGSTIPVTIDGTCFPGVDDNSTGTNSPQYGFAIGSSSKNVVLKGGVWQGNTAGIHDDGTNAWARNLNVLEATGATNAQVIASTSGLGSCAFLPEDAGLLAWNFDPAFVASSANPATNTIQAIRIDVKAPMTVTNIVLFQFVAGAGLTTSECFVGLYDSAGTKIAVSADQSTAWASGTDVFKTMALASGPFTIKPGLYWILAVQNGSSNLTWGRFQNQTATNANAGLSAAKSRWATAGTGTTLPSSFTPSALTQTAMEYWAGLS